MSPSLIAERILWAGVGGLAAIGLVLALCRLPRLHPALKVFACRLVMLKILVSPWLTLGFAARSSGEAIAWWTPALAAYLLVFWIAGAALVGHRAARAYRASARLRNRTRRESPSAAGFETYRVPELAEACVVGIWRPALLLPADRDVAPGVIEHEKSHIRHLDPAFGLVAWLAYAVGWFIPGAGRLVSEHALWQEVWADLDARIRLKIPAAAQARELLAALTPNRPSLSTALAFGGGSQAMARRLGAMFVAGYSPIVGASAALLLFAAAIPLRPEPTVEARRMISPVGIAAPMALR